MISLLELKKSKDFASKTKKGNTESRLWKHLKIIAKLYPDFIQNWYYGIRSIMAISFIKYAIQLQFAYNWRDFESLSYFCESRLQI